MVSYRSDALLQGDDLGVASQLDLFTGEGIKFLADEFHGQAASRQVSRRFRVAREAAQS